jgi:hypothetical protein
VLIGILAAVTGDICTAMRALAMRVLRKFFILKRMGESEVDGGDMLVSW